MPIGIFLFALKSEFQKSEENGEKRRKPEKISGFPAGILKMAKLLIYQGFTALFQILFKVFFVLVLPFSANKFGKYFAAFYSSGKTIFTRHIHHPFLFLENKKEAQTISSKLLFCSLYNFS